MIPTIQNASQAEGTAPETAECPSVKIEVHEGRRRSPALVGIIQGTRGGRCGVFGVFGVAPIDSVASQSWVRGPAYMSNLCSQVYKV